MKVAIFLQDLNSGGAEKVMVNYANYLSQNSDDEVLLVVVRDNGPYKNILNKKIKTISLNTKKTSYSLFALIATIQSNKVDVIYTTLVNANIIALIAGKLTNTKVIIREANTISENRKNEKRLLIKVAHHLSKYIYRWAYKSIAISNVVKEDLIKYTNIKSSQINVIYNPIIPVDELDIKLEEDIFHIAIVCRLTKQKNIDTICDIIEETIKNRLRIKYHFFGEGDSTILHGLILKYNAQDKIILHGFNISYLSYVKKMNLFIHIPLWEGLGNSVLEVYNSGIPMILSDIKAGYSELISKDYKNIHYVNPTDKNAIIEIIFRYYSRVEEGNTYDREKLNFDLNETYKQYHSLAS